MVKWLFLYLTHNCKALSNKNRFIFNKNFELKQFTSTLEVEQKSIEHFNEWIVLAQIGIIVVQNIEEQLIHQVQEN